jgi:hypothetical protein
MPDKADSWVETLGVKWFKSAEDAAPTGTSDEASSSNDALDSEVESAADAAANSVADSAGSDSSVASAVESAADSATTGSSDEVEDSDFQAPGQLAPADIVGDSDGSTLIVDPPIGVLQLRSASQVDSAGTVFDATVDSSAKDGLLLAALATGTSIGTVKISQPTGTTTLKNVLIMSLNSSGGTVDMRLQSSPPKKKRPGAPSSPILVIAAPIGSQPLLAFSPDDKAGRQFDVTIPITPSAALLLAAAASGQSLGTVQISTPDILNTLRDTQIASLNGGTSTIQMRLESSSPAEISE